ncbi:MAG: VOC family protein [Chitinophagaceae bacterium]|nr:VOC family protein [Chitinophagaceae bacterium]
METNNKSAVPGNQKITPFLWFNDNAEEAVNFYASVFKEAKINGTTRYNAESAKASGQKEGSAMTIAFNLNGQDFTAINGGPVFKFTEAVSFVVHCQNQEEVDHYWNKLTEGGQESNCGWLKDKFGLSWQIVPQQLMQLLQDKEPGKAKRAMHAMLQMKKIDIKKLEEA